MANIISEAVATGNLTVVNTIAKTDYVLVTANVSANANTARTRNITKHNLFTNGTHDGVFANLVVSYSNTPANSTALTIARGQIFYDNNYLYIAVANNLVKRVALGTF